MNKEYYGVRRVGDNEEAYIAHVGREKGWKMPNAKYIARLITSNGTYKYIYNQAQLAAAKGGQAMSRVRRTAQNAAGELRKRSGAFRQVDNALGMSRSGAQVKKARAQRARVTGKKAEMPDVGKIASNAAKGAKRTAQNAAGALRKHSKAFRKVDNALGLSRSGAQVKKANAQRAKVNGKKSKISSIAKGIQKSASNAIKGARRSVQNVAGDLRKSNKTFRKVDNALGISRSGAQVKKANAQRAKVKTQLDDIDIHKKRIASAKRKLRSKVLKGAYLKRRKANSSFIKDPGARSMYEAAKSDARDYQHAYDTFKRKGYPEYAEGLDNEARKQMYAAKSYLNDERKRRREAREANKKRSNNRPHSRKKKIVSGTATVQKKEKIRGR